MAGVTISKSKNGNRRLLFFDLHDRTKRHQLGLGAMPKAEADTIKSRVEKLRACRIADTTPPDAINEWLASLPDEWHTKLVEASLAEPRFVGFRETPTLGELVELFKSQSQWSSNTEGTHGTYRRTFRHMQRRFGVDTRIDTITAGHAKDFRPFLEGEKPDGCGLAVSTASATITQVKTLFELAVDYEILDRNPFRKLPTPQHAADKAFVSAEKSQKVSLELPNDEWRLGFALARWCGVRVISEIRGLVWSDVDFANRELLVRSPKTARYPDGASRVVPLFDEVELLMRKRFDEAAAGELHVLPNVRVNKTTFRETLIRAIDDAGFDVWPELFNSLRSTRETELLQLGIPVSEVAEIIGHSVRVAEKNYVQQMGRERRQAMLAKARTNGAQNLVETNREQLQRETETTAQAE